jgi:hypothetical protein
MRIAQFWIIAVATVPIAFSLTSANATTSCAGVFRFVGPRTELQGRTKKDQPCGIYYGKRSDITSFRLIERPRNGVLGTAGNRGGLYLTAYKPNSGYVGPDEFTVEVGYSPRATHVEKSTIVHVQMTVSP